MINTVKLIQSFNNRVMYCHQMDIKRQGTTKQPDGSSKQTWILVQEGVPCKLSQDSADKADDIKEDINPIKEAFTIFCAPEVEVKAGDLLEIGGVNYRAGNPFMYPTHQEISATRRDLA